MNVLMMDSTWFQDARSLTGAPLILHLAIRCTFKIRSFLDLTALLISPGSICRCLSVSQHRTLNSSVSTLSFHRKDTLELLTNHVNFFKLLKLGEKSLLSISLEHRIVLDTSCTLSTSNHY